MNELQFEVRGNRLRISNGQQITSGSIQYDCCRFQFDSRWDSCVKTAVFGQDPNNMIAVLLQENCCYIPAEALAQSGRMYVGVYGIREDGTRIPTNLISYQILQGAPQGENIAPPSEDYYQQIMQQLAQVSEQINALPDWVEDGTKPTYTAEEVGAAAKNHIHDEYQSKLTAGANIVITDDNVISAVTGGESSGTTDYTILQNKPSINGIPLTGDLSSYTLGIQPHGNYVLESDFRLTNARPASDVSDWAKEPQKPAYTATEVGAAAEDHAHEEYQSKLTAGVNIVITEDNVISAVASEESGSVLDYVVLENKPAINGVTLSGNLTSEALGVQPVGDYITSNDPRLSDARPAADVSDWAKAAEKPTYTAAEVGALPASTIIPEAADVNKAYVDEALANKSNSDHTHTAAEIGALPADTIIPPAADVDKAYVDAGLARKAELSVTVPATLAASGWSDGQIVLSVAGVTANSNNELLPALGITGEQLKALQKANIQDGGQSDGNITLICYGTQPTIDIPIRVVIRGDTA